MTVVGVDLRASPSRPSTLVNVDEHLRLVSLQTFAVEIDLLEVVKTQQPSVIAIGAPLSLPAGLCCLEPECECDFKYPDAKGRQFELELSRLGISCFFTNKTSIVRDLIYRGVELKRRLGDLGFHVIEVYPYAAKVILFGDKMPRGKTSANLTFLRDRLSTVIPGLDRQSTALNLNACNAAINAYTGVLYSRNCAELLGDVAEGTLVVPRLPR